MGQLAFEWQMPASYAPEDFIVSDSNAEATAFLDSWPNTQAKSALLIGEASSGKTHLVHKWLGRIKGEMLNKEAFGTLPSEYLWHGNTPAVLEDIETIKNEAALFHLLRHSETSEKHLLLTSHLTARQLPFTLPDLTSRLLALPTLTIDPPDDKLTHIFIAKCFSDRQLRVSDEIILYIQRRAERSFARLYAIIHKIENASLESKKKITIPLVKKIMDI